MKFIKIIEIIKSLLIGFFLIVITAVSLTTFPLFLIQDLVNGSPLGKLFITSNKEWYWAIVGINIIGIVASIGGGLFWLQELQKNDIMYEE